MPVAAATVREFRVLWYEAQLARSIINPGKAPQPLPASKPKRKSTFHVKARTLDGARRAAREHVMKRLDPRHQLLSINFTLRPHELVIYTSEKKVS